MTKRFLISLITVLGSLTYSFAQNGFIRGTVFDAATGEALIGVTIVVEGTVKGTVTDIDGKFEFQVESGTYTLKISYVSYTTLIIENTTVVSGEVALLDNILLKENAQQLTEVVISAQAIKVTEEALLAVKMKSANLLDGISSTSFRKIGDSDAAAAVKRVPGVSVEDGKYVFVRGLGDRYTKSTLNGVDIPGLDPDRNTVQMDMFPTSLIDNIIVLKSFTPDLPGDFTGGVVDIGIKDFPEEKTFNVSINGGYNPAMHFNNDYLTYKGGSTDFLGFDDGTRASPVRRNETIPQYPEVITQPDTPEGIQFRSILEGFNPTMAAMKKKSFMDYGFGVNFGNQITRGENTFGYNFSLVYKNTTEYFEGAEFGTYGKGNADEYELLTLESQNGNYGLNSAILSGLAGFALKRENAKYRISLLHSQNGESKAGQFEFIGSDFGSIFESSQTNLEYSQRSLTNLLIGGTHFSNNKSWQVEWKLSPTRSRITDPDIRFLRYRTDLANLTINTEVGFPERIWRYLEEDNIATKVDVVKNMQAFSNPAKLKFGGGYTYKKRDYEIQNFQFVPENVTLTGDPNEIFSPENLWPTNPSATQGTRYEAGFIPDNTNKFDANSANAAFYISGEFGITQSLKTILGVRVENYTQFYTGLNQKGLALNNEQVLDELNFFPSVNLIYALTETQNLRFSYSKTVARPSFKEASYAQIFDPITGRTFIGGFSADIDTDLNVVYWDGKLTSSRIDNFDLRWEIFQKRGQTFSVSGFYKIFDRPIEMVQFVTASNNFQPRNVGDGQALGLELELRQNLSFITESLEGFSVNGNVTFTKSEIDMSVTEYNARVQKARDGESIEKTRNMAGQAPYIINAGIAYNGIENGFEVGLYYNVQGQTLTYVGIAEKPDVYSVPFNSLNFNANKTLGGAQKLRVGLGLTNILNSDKTLVYKSFKAEDRNFSKISPGTRINFSVGYSF